NWVVFFAMMQRYYFLLENMYRAMIIFWLTCLVGYPRTSAPEPRNQRSQTIKKRTQWYIKKWLKEVNFHI
ncbi:hypothetical protein V7T14_14035, partial [Segatella copri]|uniref:hypothetical protein n=1 Tax=Segatella copri TaxID=165179 RepID=UPI001C486971